MASRDAARTLTVEAQGAFQVLSLNDSDPRVRDYKKRKLHKKTKLGCLTCKVKKVKVCLYSSREAQILAYSKTDV